MDNQSIQKRIEELEKQVKELKANEIGVIMTDKSRQNLFNSVKMSLAGRVNLGIGTSNPNLNSILDLSSTNLVFLPPRMTTAQRDAIISPPNGGIIFNTTTGVLNQYNSGWTAV